MDWESAGQNAINGGGFMGQMGGFLSGSGGQALGGLLGGILGQTSYQNPGNAANQYLNQIGPSLQPMFQPYMNAGSSMLNPLMSQYSNLMNNPGQMMNQLGQGFQQSPGYQWDVSQATNAANHAAAAGGMAGTPQAQQQMAQNISGIANQDYYNYLSHATGLMNTGLQGAQNIAGMGMQATGEYGNDLAQSLAAQASAAYNGAQSQNNQNNSFFGSMGGLLGDVGTIASWL